MINSIYVEIYKARRLFNSGWRWRVKAINGNILADSGQAYVRRDDALNGLEQTVGLRLLALAAATGVPPGKVEGMRINRVSEMALEAPRPTRSPTRRFGFSDFSDFA